MQRKIIIVCSELSFPPQNGTDHDILGHIKFFNDLGWKIILVIYSHKKINESNNIIKDYLWDIEILYLKRKFPWTLQENLNTVNKMNEVLKNYNPQIIWFEYSHFSKLAEKLETKGVKVWFRSHNFELAHIIDKKLAGFNTFKYLKIPKLEMSSIITKGIYDLFLRSFLSYYLERKMLKIANSIFFISPSDKKYMNWVYHGKSKKYFLPPFLISNKVPVKESKKTLDIIYTGVFYYDNNPSLLGGYTLLKSIVPAVRRELRGHFNFHIVGRGSKEKFAQFKSKDILLYDFIDDLKSFYNNMDISCVPIKYGWGSKIKILEAIASGLPVIGNRQAFRGIPKANNIYIVCNNTKEYLGALKSLLDPKKRKELSKNSLLYYNNLYEEGKQTLNSVIANEI